MDNKIKIKIAVATFLITALVIGGLTWMQNRELSRAKEEAAKNTITGVAAPQEIVPENPKEAVGNQSSAVAADSPVSENAASVTDTIKKISCSFKAKEGDKSDQATVSWDCKNIEGWTCRIIQDYVKKSKIRLSGVKLPKDSDQVAADEAETKETTVTSGSGVSSTADTVVEAPNDYRLECVSGDGKVRNFIADTYWNENS
ncbi:MAG: hypothetical protein WC238_03475 [Parcubacteria group bacterium]|jgi:hypothetical protein